MAKRPSVADAVRAFDAARGAEVDAAPAPEPTAEASPRRVGRPPGGKKSSADYVQVSAYVRKRLYRDVKIALLMDDDGRDFSELVDGLLAGWLERRKGNDAPG